VHRCPKGIDMRLLSSRKYVSGTRWGFWRWTDVDSEYIVRLHIVKAPFGALCVHWIKKPDPEPYAHDHPVSFLSIILRGSYAEEVEGRNRSYPYIIRHDYYNYIPTRKRHRIIWCSAGGCLTLAVMGPKTNEWGFFTPKGKIPWKTYYAVQRAERRRSAGRPLQ
jgi:hypothetical protein